MDTSGVARIIGVTRVSSVLVVVWYAMEMKRSGVYLSLEIGGSHILTRYAGVENDCFGDWVQ